MAMKTLTGGRLPIKSWATDIGDGALGQATNLANLDVARSHVALMPDAHHGFGMPIGGVLLTEGAVVPYAIGVDIGCGVRTARTNLTWGKDLTAEKLRNVLRQIQRDIPTGFSVNKQPLLRSVDDMIDRVGDFPDIRPARSWLQKALPSLGSLGGGNHFLEAQADEEGGVYFMLHSGSRNLGKQICEHFVALAVAQCTARGIELPDKDLAYLDLDSEDGQLYWAAMSFALNWAELNRELMMGKAEHAFRKHAGVRDFDVLGDVHHNYAALETHAGFAGVVHRKGAVRATAGEQVFIPGSMATSSYIGEGLGNPDSFQTCQHGAGRKLGRGAAKRAKTSEEVFGEMRDWGIEFISNEPQTAAEEAAFAYKDIESVMAASADLVRPTVKLRPLGVVKG